MKSNEILWNDFQFQRGTQPLGKQKKQGHKQQGNLSCKQIAYCKIHPDSLYFSDVLIDSSCTTAVLNLDEVVGHQLDGIPFSFCLPCNVLISSELVAEQTKATK